MLNSLLFTIGLPLIFILHNIEEFLCFDKFKDTFYKYIGKQFQHRNIFLYAIIILSLIVVITVILNQIYANNIVHSLTIIIFLAVFINGLQHCLGSIYFRQLLPGTLTAFILIIPFSIYILFSGYKEIFTGIDSALMHFVLSLLVMYLSIFISLWIGFFINKFFQFSIKLRGLKHG